MIAHRFTPRATRGDQSCQGWTLMWTPCRPTWSQGALITKVDLTHSKAAAQLHCREPARTLPLPCLVVGDDQECSNRPADHRLRCCRLRRLAALMLVAGETSCFRTFVDARRNLLERTIAVMLPFEMDTCWLCKHIYEVRLSVQRLCRVPKPSHNEPRLRRQQRL
jgi:hypothetical protein